MTAPLCHCGKPLHYNSLEIYARVAQMCEEHGENITIHVGHRSWLVQRHYIALHGLKAAELPSLGFPEIGRDEISLLHSLGPCDGGTH